MPPVDIAGIMDAPNALQILHTISSMRQFRSALSGSVSLVPTMGMLHRGHLSLVCLAAEQTQSVIVSIYANPTQLAKAERNSYPSKLELDVAALERLNEALHQKGQGQIRGVFAPTDEEMYPYLSSTDIAAGQGSYVSISPLAGRLEGADQPAHFIGVATVCLKLFNAVKPHKAYFGEKDFQQTVIIKRLIDDFLVDLKLVVSETVREEDGLALSSRNVYLGSRRRKIAPVLWKTLSAAANVYYGGELRRGVILASCNQEARKEQDTQDQTKAGERARFEVLYFGLSNLKTIEDLEEVDPKEGALLSGAIQILPLETADQTEDLGWRGGTDSIRLIDSIVLKPI